MSISGCKTFAAANRTKTLTIRRFADSIVLSGGIQKQALGGAASYMKEIRTQRLSSGKVIGNIYSRRDEHGAPVWKDTYVYAALNRFDSSKETEVSP